MPRADFRSYYGVPVLNPLVWQTRDIAGYLFLGGLAGASSLLGAGAQATGLRGLAGVSKVGALGAAAVSLVALVHDLGRPERFLHMLRVFKPTSPMSVGSWLLTGYAPLAGSRPPRRSPAGQRASAPRPPSPKPACAKACPTARPRCGGCLARPRRPD